jgi:predicted component of type VI protein secretion system
MIMLLILKLLGFVEYMLDYLMVANMTVTRSATDGQWTLAQVYVAPTAKGWAILTDIMTILHNVLDMVAQFSTLFPINNSMGVGYTVGNNIVGFGSTLNYSP